MTRSAKPAKRGTGSVRPGD